MDLQLAGKSTLITGASKGIGRAAAQALAEEGCNVILVSRSAGALAAAREQIRQSCDVKVDVVAADLSDSSKVDELARDFPNIDILVNNAGAIPGGTLLDIDEKTWRKAWDLKVFPLLPAPPAGGFAAAGVLEGVATGEVNFVCEVPCSLLAYDPQWEALLESLCDVVLMPLPTPTCDGMFCFNA